MGNFIYSAIGTIYRKLLKPILFRFHPDGVHAATMKLGLFVGALFGAPFLMRLLFRRVKTSTVQVLDGVTFPTPVGMSAGLDKSAEIVPVAEALGFGFQTVGSVTFRKCDGNPKPWFYRLPKSGSLVVNAGLANQGSARVLKRVRELPKSVTDRMPLVLSVAKTNSPLVVSDSDAIADYVGTLKRVRMVGNIRVVELNISCPNAYGGEAFTTPERLKDLLLAVSGVGLSQPIYLKMPSHLEWPEFKELLDVAVDYGVSGVTIANLAKDRQAAVLSDELPDTILGNLSGKPSWNLSNELIARTFNDYGDKLTIIGAGGIFNAADAYIKVKLGAHLVELITGLIFEGPQLASQINTGIANLLAAEGYHHISQARGVDAVAYLNSLAS